MTDSPLNHAGGSVDKERRFFLCPHIPIPETQLSGENITFKTQRELVKRLFVEITKTKQ